MKRLLVINPNTSRLFTKRIAAVARRSTELQVETVNPNKGPRSIESAYDELLSCAPTLETYLQARRSGPIDGVVVAAPAPQGGISSALEALAALHQKGALTDGEFAAAKAKLLG